MEGPSLVIACEEFKPFIKQKITRMEGADQLPLAAMQKSGLTRVMSWGKHFILFFGPVRLRIHFLMFGSYRINDPRTQRVPKMTITFGSDKIYFYSCAIKQLSTDEWKAYDWSRDLMSEKWDQKQAISALLELPKSMVCDLLLDQAIFSGLRNIMKNEILFRLKMHPETKIENLTKPQVRKLAVECEAYAWKFYDWKKINQLKRNWQIMRKRKCPDCGGAVTKKATGKLQRLSHFCKRCQLKTM